MADVSSSSITIRDAGPQDVGAIATLGARVFSETFGHSVSEEQLKAFLDESYSIEATAKDVSDPNKDMIVATSPNGAIVGFALLTRGSSEPCIAHLDNFVELQRIYVDSAHHGQGVGKHLARRVEEMAKSQGFKHMWLGVWEENFKAQKVYEKLGYQKAGDHDFVIGDVVQTDNIMIKEL
jgi:ribosomal protein S18 acetylase RimI-like enzyme